MKAKVDCGLVAPARVFCELERQEMDTGELGIVVEHFLEVRDEPEPIRRVAVITTSELVADAASGHSIEREQHHVQGIRGVLAGSPAAVLVEEEVQIGRLRELGSTRIVGIEAESAVFLVELLGEQRATLGRPST